MDTHRNDCLARFILDNMSPILGEWERFARSIPSTGGMNTEALRDHAEQILRAIALDMQSEQSDAEQEAKSQGRQPRVQPSPDTAAESHGTHRFDEGFNLNEMVSEYRALRASVLRLWNASTDAGSAGRTLYELTRFNEAVDQALAESLARFSGNLDRSRELFMGVLGHDMRTHLQVIMSSSAKLRKESLSDEQQRFSAYIEQSAVQITQLVGDLLDVARTRLGGELPLDIETVHAREVCEKALRPFLILHPECELKLDVPEQAQGQWDRERLIQLLANLLRNAIQHGDRKRRITLAAAENEDTVRFSVHNFGTAIPANLIHRIFEPMQRGAARDRSNQASVGLGLYIAGVIAQTHGGTLTVQSEEEAGTVFTASLPKNRPSID